MPRSSILAAALAAFSAPAFAAHYVIDPGHTQVEIKWSHFGFSNPTAQFGKLEGTLDFDPAKPAEARTDIKVHLDSINSNVPDLDAHLRGPEFFDAAKYPIATFRSTKVEKAAGDNAYRVHGELDLHGVKKPLVLEATLNKIGEHPMTKAPAIGFDAKSSIKRSEFGIDKYVPNVSDEIPIRITLEAQGEKADGKTVKAKTGK